MTHVCNAGLLTNLSIRGTVQGERGVMCKDTVATTQIDPFVVFSHSMDFHISLVYTAFFPLIPL